MNASQCHEKSCVTTVEQLCKKKHANATKKKTLMDLLVNAYTDAASSGIINEDILKLRYGGCYMALRSSGTKCPGRLIV